MNHFLLDYIKRCFANGKTPDMIRSQVLSVFADVCYTVYDETQDEIWALLARDLNKVKNDYNRPV